MNQKKIEDFIISNRMQNEIIDKCLTKASQKKRYFNYFCLLLDTYCNVKRH